MDEITVRDLLAWDERLRPLITGPGPALSRDVSWVVAARAMAPALPTLRGGEVILLPEAVFVEQGLAIQSLLPELARQRVAAVVVDRQSRRLERLLGQAPLPVLSLHGAVVSVDIESELNRLLTERRGEIYRLGAELGRLLSGLTAGGAGLKQVLDLAHAEIAMPIIVTDRTGLVLAAAPNDPDDEAGARRFPPSEPEPDVIEHPLRGGGRVWLGPVAPANQARARVAADRLAVAIEAALTGANWFRPRGPERAEALRTFVLTAAQQEPSDVRVQAVAAGLDPNGTFRVAMSPSKAALQGLHRWYGRYGVVHELADIGGYAAVLIETKRDHPGRAPTDAGATGPPGAPRPVPAADQWVATSGPAGLAGLSEAMRQGIYVAGLLAAGLIPGPAVSFDRTTEMGSFRLLYRFWGSAELASFAAEVLGDLVSQDRNGVLRHTLLHFLESGGSRVAAAERAAIHRNTLTYRLHRITELTRLDPTAPADRLSLHLAVLALLMPAAPPATH